MFHFLGGLTVNNIATYIKTNLSIKYGSVLTISKFIIQITKVEKVRD